MIHKTANKPGGEEIRDAISLSTLDTGSTILSLAEPRLPDEMTRRDGKFDFTSKRFVRVESEPIHGERE